MTKPAAAHGADRADPRTHLAVLVTATVLWAAYPPTLIHYLAALCAAYLAANGMARHACGLVVGHVALTLLARASAFVMPLLYVILSTFARAIPLMMPAAALVASNPSRIMAALQEVGIPRTGLAVVCLLVRFFPVMGVEMGRIREGQLARGILPRWRDVLVHPVTAYQCFFVPLIIRCLCLSSDLGASSELRGLASRERRSCLHGIGFSRWDATLVLSMFVLGAIPLLLSIGA
ncbi:energy-coupling factor transporter transmembrane component T [Olsenella uli]|uniref:energy-coupling factor transporter transmembrane component T n=1 Tax=Olsenella uli TaxID=133926 RepID=UPI00241EE245|nr:energy-coupling factor transporter transmembrane component T [Olsenella uli]